MQDAIITGDLDYVKEHIHEYDTNMFDLASYYGYLNIVKFLHENRKEGCTEKAMDYASSNGYLDVVKFLHENRTEGCTTYAMEFASYYGYLNIVKFLHVNRTEGCTKSAMDWASWNGHLDVIKFLHENRTEGCTTFAIDWALQCGHLHVVEYLKEISKGKLILFSDLINPREEICMVCHDEMKENSKISLFKCRHFVCEECSKQVNKCCICRC